MPTYNYICKECEHQLEVKQSIKDEALKTCPKCNEDTLKRLICGTGGFILKGGGWYADLYSSTPKNKGKK